MSIKQERVSGRIRKILSVLIAREVADPRLHGVTVTDVEIDAELMHAKVFVSAMGEDEAEIIGALEHAKGFLRREVASRLGLRRAPSLGFKWDESLERGERIETLLAGLTIPPPEMTDSDPDDDEIVIDLDDIDLDEDEDDIEDDGYDYDEADDSDEAADRINYNQEQFDDAPDILEDDYGDEADADGNDARI